MLKLSQIGLHDYSIKEEIGRGTFSRVFRAIHIVTNEVVAIKVISKSSIQTDHSMTRFVRELSILKKVSHPYIDQFYEYIEDNKKHYLVLEYAPGGNLHDYINLRGALPESIARKLFSQLLSGLNYLHNHLHVAHRDLKAENVLLDSSVNVRLADFGLSTVFSSEQPKMTSKCGSPAYSSPEIIHGKPYTCAADIWSLGILLYYMTTGNLPFSSQTVEQMFEQICRSEPVYPRTMNPTLIDLIQKCLCKDPTTRISIQNILKHPWLSHYEYATIDNIFYKESHTPISMNIINQMIRYGYNCRDLPNKINSDEFDSLTAVYRILLRRQQNSDHSSYAEFYQEWSPLISSPDQSYYPRNSLSFINKKSPEPNPAEKKTISGKRILLVPNPVGIAQRRLSRPAILNPKIRFDIHTEAQALEF